MKNQLLESKIIICTGSGGVGKTTIAAALACKAAQEGKKVLVITIDPSGQLKNVLGLANADEIVRVPEQNFKGELFAGIINSEKVFKNFIISSCSNKETAQKIIDNVLYKQLSTKLSGSEEFTSIVTLNEAYASKKYDLIILDTPPAQHAIDFLEAPERIYALFQSSITKWFVMQTKKENFITQIINRGTHLALAALQKVTGDVFINELFSFFTNLKDIQEKISEKCLKVQELLKLNETSFLIVTSFDQTKHLEALDFSDYLHKNKFNLNTLIINRAYPKWYLSARKNSASFLQTIEPPYKTQAEKMLKYYGERDQMYVKLNQTIAKSQQLKQCVVPEFTEELIGLSGLQDYADYLQI